MLRHLPLLIAALFFAKGTVVAHPHYVSTGTGHWISETQTLELALKVSAEDLEAILTKAAKREVYLEEKQASDQKALRQYILSNLSITRADKTRVPAKWIGYEIEEADAWIYVEFPIKRASMEGCEMRHHILIDTFAQQVNMVNLMIGKKRKTLRFRKRRSTVAMPAPNAFR